MAGLPYQRGADRHHHSNPHDDRSVAAHSEQWDQHDRESHAMARVQLAVDTALRIMRRQRPPVVGEVVAALIVVRDLHIAIAQQALRGDEVVWFVAGWRQSLASPHGEEHAKCDDARGIRRGCRAAQHRHPMRRRGRQRNHQHATDDRAPHHGNRRTSHRQNDIRHRHRQPGQHDQQRQKQRQTDSVRDSQPDDDG